ncbi:succinate dehydrogenase/fumarate reductase flavoprotein subunit [Actinomadura pelletieri DSM 43383]|uniref:Succinate dehydrogenase/fumarate reductase flavoprotein subunit n=1 Tax=Actinomadura pelletieri DSM 43383 TaxID=1120940 RepID=A0A495QKB6_9ACTN|nr:FAD-binding protein [Actinomadura pelletieri]RKS73020.1 succinate dehydrogenase/fumarate reductase flavoprotein subunit [Actinomadura pelletieri DSM 43383]
MTEPTADATELTADVLVVGGGPAGAWAAIKAAEAGADVVLADKGYLGTSGATASAGTGVWYVEPDPDAREAAMASREGLGGHLADREWMARVLDQTYANMNELAEISKYPFPEDEHGRQIRRGLQGPEYMRRMRVRVRRSGVRILDHSPVTELLADGSGAVAGAAGYRLRDDRPFRVRAGAVVLATGGCAFLSRALGCDVNTGDGALFAAEAGAEMSGMEFSNAYAIAPAFTSVTKTAFYMFATFYHADGTVLEGAGSQRGRSVIARTLLSEPVLCRIDRATPEEQRAMRLAQANFFLPFDRQGIDPFTDLFPVTLLAEGTVRGTGGIRITGPDCATSVPGLYAAGDAATRELICGGFTGGGSHNAAWAMSSGTWAGQGAARYATGLGGRARARDVRALGEAGLRPSGHSRGRVDHADVVAAVQAEVLPYDKNLLRHGDRLTPALDVLDRTWHELRGALRADGAEIVRARSAAAMTAHARWMYNAALARTETRGMHKRQDRPDKDPAQHHRLITGGLDDIWTRPETPAPAVAS